MEIFLYFLVNVCPDCRTERWTKTNGGGKAFRQTERDREKLTSYYDSTYVKKSGLTSNLVFGRHEGRKKPLHKQKKERKEKRAFRALGPNLFDVFMLVFFYKMLLNTPKLL